MEENTVKSFKLYNEPVLADLQTRIEEVEGRARERTLQATDLLRFATRVEATFTALGIPLAARVGAVVEVSGMTNRVANSYRGVPYATEARLQRNTRGWLVTDIDRAPGRAFADGYRITLANVDPQGLLNSILTSQRITLECHRGAAGRLG
ncbi:hypothetical protein ACFQ9V_00895 [Leifsonia sp. NPDC056665]|uniref:hypothetical protein n=1 Tax=Leifsonia sp. NPDC056665 TaxID=3345901 RepID=UPI0036B53895